MKWETLGLYFVCLNDCLSEFCTLCCHVFLASPDSHHIVDFKLFWHAVHLDGSRLWIRLSFVAGNLILLMFLLYVLQFKVSLNLSFLFSKCMPLNHGLCRHGSLIIFKEVLWKMEHFCFQMVADAQDQVANHQRMVFWKIENLGGLEY